MSTTRALRVHQPGPAASSVALDTLPLHTPAPGEALVRVLATPVNPADLNLIEGKYGRQPALPFVPGTEGVAVVESTGPGVSGLSAGDHVLLPSDWGAWRERGTLPAADLIAVPRDIPVHQAAMLRVNPCTALLMLREFAALSPGDHVIQNAANSGVGRCVIALARARGIRTINIVRRPELVDELKALGADTVVCDANTTARDFREAAGGAPVRLALNAVGGESALRLANTLAPGGVHITYGAMGLQPLRVPNSLLIFRDITFRGFWVTRWFGNAAPESRRAVISEVAALAQSGVLHVPVAAAFGLEDFASALGQAAAGARAGKILFTPGTCA
jgi:trans-2-enoyl-CoA reductase